jgi:uncharacterized RDD family membrane protein YckC
MRYDGEYASPRYANFFMRAFALFIDLTLLLFSQTVMLFLYANVGWINQLHRPAQWSDMKSMLHVMQPLTTLVYFVVFEAACGATLGKLIVGIRVVTEDGTPVGPGRALVRNLVKILSFMFPILFLMPLWTSRKQALHDMATYCYVVRA